jgi:hypothetical protein
MKISDKEILEKYLSGADDLPYILKNNEISLDGLTDEQSCLSDRALEYYDEISQILEKRGLRFFVMKTFRSYPYVDSDMDIVLVDKARRQEYMDALRELGFASIWNVSILREPRKRFFVKLSDDGQIKLPIAHVHFTVSWNGIDCLNSDDVWRRLRSMDIRGKCVKAPSVEDELLIMAAHTMHENTYITIGELLHIKNLLSENKNIDIDYMVSVCKKYNWLKAFKIYLSHAEACYFSIAQTPIFPADLKAALNVRAASKIPISGGMPPFILPGKVLAAGYISKVSKDLIGLRLRNIPRELLTFGLVIWLFRKKKLAKFKIGAKN